MKPEEQNIIQGDGWLVEKVLNSLAEVSGAVRWAKELEALGLKSQLSAENARKYGLLLEGITSELYAALYDLTKIATKLNDPSKWNSGDRDEIYDNGRQGLADVLVKYGFPDWLPYLCLDNLNDEDKVDVQDVLLRIRELSQGPPGGNRTFIYIELRRIAREQIARQILDLIEPVTQGEKSWSLFQQEITELLKDI